jgi:hypothetical protein
MLENLCMPALIYLIFAVSHVIIATYKGFYNAAFIQIWITLLFTFLLNTLCQNDLSIISWIIISIPFLFMTLIAAILLYMFGLNPTSGLKQIPPPKPSNNPQPPSETTYAYPVSVQVEPFHGVQGYGPRVAPSNILF